MDYAACNVVYVDRTASEDKLVKRDDAAPASLDKGPAHGDYFVPVSNGHSTADENLQVLLETFSEVHVCTSGTSCVSKLSELNQACIVELIPTLVLIDIPYEDQLNERSRREIRARTPSPSSHQIEDPYDEQPREAYGLKLLQWIASEIQYQSLSRLVVPVAVVSIPAPQHSPIPTISWDRRDSVSESQSDQHFSQKKHAGLVKPLDRIRTVRYLDIGAVDVLTSPLLRERLPSLAIHAYRAHKDASKEHRALLEMKRGRKRSWVGVDDQKPYAYLREAMVSGLMDGICKVGDEDESFGHVRISIALDRREKISTAVGSWNFSAHEFTDDELLHAALLMLQHALAMPELEKWRISTENLTGFLIASRSAYNAFVPYHNFRHVVDVLQACFHFLVRLRRLPPYPTSYTPSDPPPSPIAELIRPFDALTLLITAIGHDVGHPGVNNAFLVTLNAPLAQLYNDRSVLESFHCAAYSQILRRHWPAAFQGVEMRQLMISSILATDMGLHFDYMKKMGWMQEKLHESGGTDGWNGRLIEEQRTLACSLLIKCADISNVARKYDVAAQWTMILTDEFARQASMEHDLGIPSALFAAPVREVVELGKSQVNFMNMFAIPLFQGVTDVMPGMAFCVDELKANKSAWEKKIAEEQARVRRDRENSIMKDGTFSPRTLSVANPSDASYQKLSNATSLSPDSYVTKALRSNSTSTNGILDQGETHHQSLPELTSSPVSMSPVSIPESASTSSSDFNSKRAVKPSQLQLSFATASAPGLLDHPSQDAQVLQNGERHINGFSVMPSLVTDAVVVDPPTPQEERRGSGKQRTQRSSEGTEESNSALGDWTSQATSATTGKMPLSPSTKGTSIMSDSDSLSKGDNHVLTPTGTAISAALGPSSLSQTPSPSHSPRESRDKSENSMAGADEPRDKDENKGLMMEKVRTLKKKPSRFRMNFWKRSKSASPPMPVGGARVGTEDDRGSQ